MHRIIPVLFLLLTALLVGCGDDGDDGGSGTVEPPEGWQEECAPPHPVNPRCPGELVCGVFGQCTTSCEVDADCTAIDPGTTCQDPENQLVFSCLPAPES